MKFVFPVSVLFVLAYAHYDVGFFDVTRQVRRQDCCDICLCQNETISCTSRQLYFTPENISDNVNFFDLEGNHITVLARDSLSNLTQLTHLNFKWNELKALHKFAFYELPSLRTLDLSHNELENIRLVMPEKLEKLDLSSNKLDWIVDPSVLHASHLKVFNLSHNLIKAPRFQLDPVFLNFSELEVLDVSGNVFMSLVGKSLEFLPQSVEMLNLAHCDMIDAEPGALTNASRHLMALDLSGNYLTLNELKALFANMANNSIRTIRLSKMKIQEVVPDPFFPEWSNLESVDFSQNRIQMVSDIAFRGTKIQILDLSDNLLKGAFLNLSSRNIPSLHTLYLNGNDLDWIPNLDLEKLNHLDLSRNQLRNLDTSSLRLTNLTKFLARENMISEIDLSIFDYFVHFDYLDLSYNLLTYLDLSPAVARRLHSLKISHNNITELFIDHSKRHFHLEVLDLSYNKLAHLPIDFLQRMPKLRQLNLAGNPNLIGRGALSFSSRKLEYLDISDNNLNTMTGVLSKRLCTETLVLSANAFTEIREADFENVNAYCLQTLVMIRNELSTINFTVFERYPLLERIDLSQNPYRCGCGLEDFLEWIRTTRIKLKAYSVGYKCQSPLEVSGLEIWSIRKSLTDDCTPLSWFTQKGVYLTLGLTLVLFLALLLTLLVSRDSVNICRRKFVPDNIYVSCTEKVKNLRRYSKDYPQLFSPGGGRSPTTSGYHHLETDTSQC